MSKQTNYPVGKVIKGDYQGLNIYNLGEVDYSTRNFHTAPYSIVSGDQGVIQIGGWFPSSYNVEKTLDLESVESYKVVSSSDREVDSGAVVKGTMLFGSAGGVLAGMTNQNTSHTIAIYFKDGKKSLIQMKNTTVFNNLINDLFDF